MKFPPVIPAFAGLLLVSTALNVAFTHETSKTPDNIFLTPQDHVIRSSAEAIQELGIPDLIRYSDSSAPRVAERNKIMFLITRMSHSPFRFIRNGKDYPSERAASHVRRKYRKSFRAVKTAREFIDNIASYSMNSGQIYLMQVGNHQRYPVHDILYNELNRLERLANQSTSSE